ncbi:MAG: UDP-N-acetylglucosamine 2-epimerase, partial [Duncaniella sp.]|nr:UDP-N-acetylglucosamine 2-epimerase [Duncaniella sp.]
MRKIAIASGTRADWGLLSGPARALQERDDCEVFVLATNMHLSRCYGHTIDEIRADGIRNIIEVPMATDGDTPLDAIMAMAECQIAMGECLTLLRPDLIVILGDRFEMLATATAALMLRIPIVHIAGGELSEGALADSIR